MRRRSTVLLRVITAGVALVACRDDGGPPAAVCDPFDVEVPTGLGLGEEPTFGDAVRHGDRLARGELVQLFVYLRPDASEDDIAAVVETARSVVDDDDRDLEVLDQEDALAEATELFEDSPELLDAVSPDNLPSSVRLVVDDAGAADAFLEEIDDDVVYRTLDSRGEGLMSERLGVYGSDEGRAALDALSEQEDDPDVAAAATVFVTEPEDLLEPGPSGDPIAAIVAMRDDYRDALATLADVAGEC